MPRRSCSGTLTLGCLTHPRALWIFELARCTSIVAMNTLRRLLMLVRRLPVMAAVSGSHYRWQLRTAIIPAAHDRLLVDRIHARTRAFLSVRYWRQWQERIPDYSLKSAE